MLCRVENDIDDVDAECILSILGSGLMLEIGEDDIVDEGRSEAGIYRFDD
jgi:hypothetical protein